jgi:UDP-N-acetylmuramoyl-tripeptide--D-alanyl-D-alanine ligase
LNVGSAHIELLGSREAIAKAKGEIFTRLKPNSNAVLFADDNLVSSLGGQTTSQKITFGQSDASDVKIQNLKLDQDAKPTFDVVFGSKTRSVSLNIVGEHQAFNAAAVIAICMALDLDFDKVCEAVSKANPVSKWRMEVTELANGVTLVNDAYNANPESMRAGLKALKAMAGDRRTWAVLGQMRELGKEADVAHDEIGRLCVRLDVNRLVAVGQGAKLIQMGASLEGSWGNESIFVETIDEALKLLKSELKTGDIVYLKASRAIGLESVAQALTLWASGKNTHS